MISEDDCERAYEKGYIQGANAGYGKGGRDGFKEGYEKGFREGYKKGWRDGFEKGWGTGFKKGREEEWLRMAEREKLFGSQQNLPNSDHWGFEPALKSTTSQLNLISWPAEQDNQFIYQLEETEHYTLTARLQCADIEETKTLEIKILNN